jgi:hypothetical protein
VSASAWGRIPALAGIVAVILIAVGFVLGGSPPKIDDSNGDIVSYFADDRGRVLISFFLGGLAGLPVLVFLAGFTRLLRRAEGEDSFLATAAYGGGVVLVAGALACTGLAMTAAFSVNKDYANEDMIRLLWNTQAIGFNFVFVGMGTFALAAGLSMVRSGALNRWLGWGGIITGVLGLVASFSFDDSGAFAPGGWYGFIPIILWMAFVLVSSILMLTQERAAQPMARMAPAV